MARIVFDKVTKKFGKKVIVDNLSMEVAHGGFVCLLGPGSSGKTTILRMIAGLERVTEGDIYIDDQRVNDLEPAERDVAMVFQTFALYPHKTVHENLAFPLKKRGMTNEEINQRVREIAATLRITTLLNKRPALLSGGEKQRVSLGRAMVREPKVFLFDEPLTNLDAKLRLHMRAELKKLQKQIGQTAIFTTADGVEALTMADKIAVLNEGKLLQYDKTLDIYDHPGNLFVARFLGSPPINVFNCRLREDGEQAFLDFEGHSLGISDRTHLIKEEAKGSDLLLGIRPTDIQVWKEEPAGDRIRSQIYVKEPMGTETVLAFKIGETYLNVKVPATIQFDRGDNVWLTFNKEVVHLFDAKTQETVL